MSENGKTVVLVADDEPTMRALVTAHLRGKGYKVLEAADGDEAWELAHEHLPHLVVLDVMMPGMSGWEVCRKIREAVSLAHTGVIMLTGIGEHLNEMTSPLYGADAYVDKPFEFSKLDDKIRQTLDHRRSAAAARGEPRGGNGVPVEFAADMRAVKSSEIREAAKAKRKTSRKKTAAKAAAPEQPAPRPPAKSKAPAGGAAAKKAPAKAAPKKAAPKKAAPKRAPKKTAPKKAAAKRAGKRQVAARKAPKKTATRNAPTSNKTGKAAPRAKKA